MEDELAPNDSISAVNEGRSDEEESGSERGSASLRPSVERGDWVRPAPDLDPRWAGFLVKRKDGVNRGKRVTAKCTFCSEEMDGRPERLEQHIVSKCKSVGEERVAYLRRLNQYDEEQKKKSAAAPQSKRRKRNAFSDASSTPPSACSAAGSASGAGTLLAHFHPPLSAATASAVDFAITKAFVTGNVPFRFASNPYLLQALGILSPAYRPLTRHSIGGILTQITRDEAQKLVVLCGTAKSWTLQLDGWEDSSGASIYAMVAVTPGMERLLDLWDVTQDRHNAELLHEKVNMSCRSIGLNLAAPGPVNAFCTDSPSVMKKLRRLVSTEHPHIIGIRCVLHNLNLLVKDIVKHDWATSVIKKNLTLVNWIHKAPMWRRLAQIWAGKHDVAHSLATHTDSRWYSLITVCLGIDAHQPWFRLLLSPQHAHDGLEPGVRPTDVPDRVLDVVKDPYHFAHNAELIQIVRPIVDALGRLEHSDATLADVLIEYSMVARTWRGVSPVVEGARETFALAKLSLNARVKEFDHAIYLVALHLSPVHRKFSVTGCQVDGRDKKRWLEWEIGKLLLAWKFRQEASLSVLAQRDDYFFGRNMFIGIDGQIRTAREFWETWGLGTTELVFVREFALMVLSIAPHSAATERVFSSLGLAKTDSRNRMNSAKLKEIGLVKSALKQEMKTLKPRVQSADEKPWRTEGTDDNLADVLDSLTLGSGAPIRALDPENEQHRDIFHALWPRIDAEEEEFEVGFGTTSVFRAATGPSVLESFLDINQLRTAEEAQLAAAQPLRAFVEEGEAQISLEALLAQHRARS